MARVLLGVLVGLAVGLGLGSVLFTEPPALEGGLAPSVGPVHAAAPADGPRSLEAPVERTGPTAPREVAPSRPVPAAPSLSEERLQSLLARTEVPEVAAAEGAGAIWGTVTGPDGAALGGVVVRAQGSGSEPRLDSNEAVGRAAPEVSLERSVREAAEAYGRWRAMLFEARTAADGSYRIERLPEGRYRLSAYKPDWEIEPRRRAFEVRTGSTVDFEALPVLELAVRVLHADGSPAEEAVIACSVRRSGREHVERYPWSPTEDVLRLRAGRVELTALAGVFRASSPGNQELSAELRSPALVVQLTPGAAPAPVELVLDDQRGIRGRVTFAGDAVQSDVSMVRLLALPGGAEVDREALSSAEPSTWLRDGAEYSFLDLPPGRYAVGVTRGWGSPVAAHRTVEVENGLTRCDIEVPPVDPSDYLVARVYGSDGEPLDGVRFTFSHEDKERGSSSSSGVPDLRGTDGAYFITIPEDARAAYFGAGGGQQVFTLRASHEEHGDKTETIAAGQAEVELRFAVPAQLEVTVGGYAGSAYVGRVRVLATPAGEETRFYGFQERNQVDADGVVRFDALEPGSYVLRLLVQPAGAGRRAYFGTPVATQTLALRPGANAAALTIPALYDLDVLVPEAEEGHQVRVQRVAEGEQAWFGNSWNERCDADGRVHFGELPAGPYRIFAGRGERRGQMTVEVPTGEVVFEAEGRR